jgi:hypothetical protein
MNCLLTRFALWLLALVLFPLPLNLYARSFEVEVLERITLAALPQERALIETEREQTERVLEYLEQAEKKEIDPWLRDDIRIAWITTQWSQHGVPDWSWHRDSPPYVAATYQVLHCRPEQVWPRIEAQRRAKLGVMYAEIYGGVSPRKPVRSEKRVRRREVAA